MWVQLGVVVFEDDPDVDVFLSRPARRTVFGCHVNERSDIRGRTVYLGTSERMVLTIFSNVSGLAVMVFLPTLAWLEFDDPFARS